MQVKPLQNNTAAGSLSSCQLKPSEDPGRTMEGMRDYGGTGPGYHLFGRLWKRKQATEVHLFI